MLSNGLVTTLAVGFVLAGVRLHGSVEEVGQGLRGSAATGEVSTEDVAVELPGAQVGAAAAGSLEEVRAGSGSLPGQTVDRTGAPVVRDAFAAVAEPTCDDGSDCFAWRTSTSWWPGAPQPAYGGAVLLVVELAALADHRDTAGEHEVIRTGGLHLVSALDLGTGAVAWRTRVTLSTDPGAGQVAAPVVVGELVLMLTSDRELVALGRDDGRERWRLVQDGVTRILDATSMSRILLVALATDARDGAPELLLSVDPADGSERWAQRAGRAIVGGSVAAVIDQSGGVQGLEPSTGEWQWEARDHRSPRLALAIGPWVLVGDRAGLTLLNAADGSVVERWVGPRVPVVWRDGNRDVVLLVTGEVLHHLDQQGRRWTTTLDEPCCLGAQVDEASVLVGLEDGTLLALARDDGQVVGRRGVRLPAGVGGTHSVAAGHRFVAREGGEAIRVHDLITGDLVARLPTETLPLVVRNRIVLSASGELVVLEGEPASELVLPGG